jgi:hypothetical protein
VSPRPTPLLVLLGGAALLLSLTGCVPEWFGSGSGSGGTSTESSATPSNGDDTAAAEDDIEGTCPVGSWTMVNESWASSLTDIFAATGAGTVTVRVSGVVSMDWNADDSYSITSARSQYDVSGTSAGSPYAMRITHDGTENGRWMADASGTYTQSGATGNVTSEVSLGTSEATLQPMELSDDTPALFSGSMTVQCTPTGMRTTVTEDGVAAAVDWVARTPAG